jgi:NAD+ synthase (glutamine-hydrolysing)
MRVALSQVDATVGDLAGNAAIVVAQTKQAADLGAQLVVFPEMMLTGYPAEDLVLRSSFVDASRAALHELAATLGPTAPAVVVGYLDRCPVSSPRVGRPAGEPQDAAAFIYGGEVVATYAKHHLPNYGVFDEFRYFVPGDRLPVIRYGGIDIAMVVCEDLWQDGGPIAVTRAAGVGLIACPNASPYERSKDDVRADLVRRRASEAGATLLYANLVGGQDELVFDGDSMVATPAGEVIARAAQFAPELLLVDVEVPPATSEVAGAVDANDGTTMSIERISIDAVSIDCISIDAGVPAPPDRLEPRIVDRLDDGAEVWAALVLGTRDYIEKNHFSSVVVGLSGGIDSALVATIARDAIGADRVHVVAMPSRYSSDGSVADAHELATRQQLHWSVLSIAAMVEAYEKAFGELEVGGLHGLAEENLQARVRGTSLMALSNEAGHLVLTTGNKSEIATGFSTLYGDSAGGYAPIKDVPKTLVWELARWRNAAARAAGEVEPIPVEIIDKAPSAELAPGQLDSDRLPDYAVLDAVLDDYVQHDKGRDELIARGHPAELVDRVIRLVDAAEYKRRQYPPGPKITSKNFGRDRRLPITNAWRET